MRPLPFILVARACVAVAVTMQLTGCAAPVTQATYIEPASSMEASRIKRVAVTPFTPLRGVDVTTDVETLLASIHIGDQRFFDVVERQRLRAVTDELRLASLGAIDAKTASKLGKMLAANGIYMGRVVRGDWVDQRFGESRQVCGQYEQKRDKKGNTYDGACQRWNTVQVQCTLRTAFFEFEPKLVSVDTGSIVYARSHAAEAKSKSCNEPAGMGGQPLKDGNSLVTDAKVSALDSFRRDIAPRERTRTIELLESTDRLGSAESKERFKGALAFAKDKRLDRACEIWQAMSSTETRSPELTYNLGVCAETSGEPTRALALYTAADRMLEAPNKTISAALARARQAQQDRAKVQTQLAR